MEDGIKKMEDEKSKYNMSQLILFRINDSAIKAMTYYRNGRIDKWFFELKNIKFQFIGKINGDERKELKKLENSISPKLYTDRKEATKTIEEYLEKIQDLLEKYKIGLVSAEDQSVFT